MLRKRGGVWHYDFVIRGVRYRGSTHERNERKAQSIESVERGKAIAGSAPLVGRRPTLAEFSQRYFEWIKATTELGIKSKKYYKHGYKVLAATTIVNMRIDAITRDEASCVQFAGSPSNQNCAIRTLRNMLGKARTWNLIATIPSLKHIEEHGRELFITPEIEARLLEVCERIGDRELADALIIISDSGMRNESEVYPMRWENQHFDLNLHFVPEGKTPDARRWIPMTKRARKILQSRNPQAEGWVFPSKRSRSGHIETLAARFRKVRKLAGLPDRLVMYCGRHGYGTYLSTTVNLPALSRAMGHKNIKTTMKYLHPDVALIGNVLNARNAMGQTASQRPAEEVEQVASDSTETSCSDGTDWVN